MAPPAPTRHSELAWPGFTSAWAWLPPHAHETVTGAHQVGVAFSGHRDVHVRSGARAGRASYPGGSVVCSGADPIVWSDVRDPTEALEIYPAADLVASVGGTGAGWPTDRTVVGAADPVVVGVAGIIRRAHVASAYLGETASSGLGHLLVRHVLTEYGGQRLPPAPGHTRLSRAQVSRVADLVAADLGGRLTLDRLAAETHLSAHHFARAFKATVGQAPHAYVTARRMDRARLLLATTGLGVADVAKAVGFANLSHFRRVFRAHTGAGPAAYRSAVR
ncbi:AraC family transcriptional regulator [Jidongwangia harbinensis]|uniref:AraC family transcriptional regulator n=1 Tax=Jidongwangia harbinensis TaxID=2878561 RepID=UPI001CDA3DA4|nr:AraC family transcriptional regulator [Jidongwangia harbinensis]MCA2216565.1 AraC family transcriptional regulator [Jidongwangia harbinensis]